MAENILDMGTALQAKKDAEWAQKKRKELQGDLRKIGLNVTLSNGAAFVGGRELSFDEKGTVSAAGFKFKDKSEGETE